jgi:hypothetical protein
MTPENQNDTVCGLAGAVGSASVVFLAWTNNCRGRADDALYVMHAWTAGPRTLCGCEVQEVGHEMDAEYLVGCRRCIRSLPNIPVSHGLSAAKDVVL